MLKCLDLSDTHTEDLDSVPDSWFWIEAALAIGCIWGVNQQPEEPVLSPSPE